MAILLTVLKILGLTILFLVLLVLLIIVLILACPTSYFVKVKKVPQNKNGVVTNELNATFDLHLFLYIASVVYKISGKKRGLKVKLFGVNVTDKVTGKMSDGLVDVINSDGEPEEAIPDEEKAEKIAKKKAAKEKAEREKAEKKAAKEKAEREKSEKKAAKERADREKSEKKAAKERAERDKAEKKAAKERAERDKALKTEKEEENIEQIIDSDNTNSDMDFDKDMNSYDEGTESPDIKQFDEGTEPPDLKQYTNGIDIEGEAARTEDSIDPSDDEEENEALGDHGHQKAEKKDLIFTRISYKIKSLVNVLKNLKERISLIFENTGQKIKNIIRKIKILINKAGNAGDLLNSKAFSDLWEYGK
ncbi:MAG: hypothetical protein K6G11_01360, partial [Lachnospiraceae bacterium]|nr:hypothetical protein [Lachnospiraceae bacterium]